MAAVAAEAAAAAAEVAAVLAEAVAREWEAAECPGLRHRWAGRLRLVVGLDQAAACRDRRAVLRARQAALVRAAHVLAALAVQETSVVRRHRV